MLRESWQLLLEVMMVVVGGEKLVEVIGVEARGETDGYCRN